MKGAGRMGQSIWGWNKGKADGASQRWGNMTTWWLVGRATKFMMTLRCQVCMTDGKVRSGAQKRGCLGVRKCINLVLACPVALLVSIF